MTRWTDDAVDTLRRLWPVRSAAEIGRTLGTTRNAVIGKAHRLGLAK